MANSTLRICTEHRLILKLSRKTFLPIVHGFDQCDKSFFLPGTRFELVTQGFSVLCSTDWAIPAKDLSHTVPNKSVICQGSHLETWKTLVFCFFITENFLPTCKVWAKSYQINWFTTRIINLVPHYINGKLSASGKKRFNSIKSPARKLNQMAASTGAVER